MMIPIPKMSMNNVTRMNTIAAERFGAEGMSDWDARESDMRFATEFDDGGKQRLLGIDPVRNQLFGRCDQEMRGRDH